MKTSSMADTIRIWAWALSSLLVAIIVSPLAFNAGKALSELSVTKDFNGAVNKFAAWSGAAQLEDFFAICWGVSALILLVPLLEWLQLPNDGTNKRAWRLRLPYGAAASSSNGQPIKKNKHGLLHGVFGFSLTFGFFIVIGYALVTAGSFSWAKDTTFLKKEFWAAFGLMLMVAYIVEIFFRCVVLGVFLRAMKPILAIALAAFMFASVLFVMSGFVNSATVDGEALTPFKIAGILFLSGDFIDRSIMIFLPWFAFGCVLGWARWRTASIWLPVGLLMGSLLSDSLFYKAPDSSLGPPPFDGVLTSLIATDSIHNGLIPFLVVIVVGCLVHLFTHGYFLKSKSA